MPRSRLTCGEQAAVSGADRLLRLNAGTTRAPPTATRAGTRNTIHCPHRSQPKFAGQGTCLPAGDPLKQHPHIEAIRRYYDVCSSGDADGVAACCTPVVVHYFLVPGTKPGHGNEHLGRYWRKVVRLFSAEWRVEHAIACDGEAAIEWSMQWTSRDDGERYIAHGCEWYAFRDGLICEIRAYSDHGRNQDTGLVDFPYAERGYTVVERTSSKD